MRPTLATTNCVVLGVAILCIQKDYDLLHSVVYAFSTVIVMLFAGLLSLAFMGFSGVDGGLKTLFGLE